MIIRSKDVTIGLVAAVVGLANMVGAKRAAHMTGYSVNRVNYWRQQVKADDRMANAIREAVSRTLEEIAKDEVQKNRDAMHGIKVRGASMQEERAAIVAQIHKYERT